MSLPSSARPVAMLVHSYYEEDPRVRREAETLVAGGHEVDVFALRRAGDQIDELLDGVHVRRLDVQRHQGAGIATYLAEYLAFFVRASIAVTRGHRHRRYVLVQVHSLPDFLAFAALPLKLAGVPLLLDLHEAMPEFFRARFARSANPISHRLLLVQEQLSIQFADAVLTVNDALAERLVGLGARPDKVTVILNSPSLRRFDPALVPHRPFAADGTVRLVYVGALSPTYEIDIVLRAMALIETLRPELPIRLDLHGRDYGELDLVGHIAALGLSDRVTFHGRTMIEAVPAAIAEADIGLAPTRRNAFTDYSLSTKLFEYAAMGKPVVASHLPMVERTFAAGTVATYQPGDADDLAARIVELVDRPDERRERVAATLERVRELSWENEAQRYVAVVDRLAARAHR